MFLVILVAVGCGTGPEEMNQKGIALREEWHRTEEDGPFRGAARSFWEATQMDPKNPVYHYNLGTLLAETRCYQFALPELKKAVELRPDYKDAVNNLEYVQEALAAKEEQCETRLLPPSWSSQPVLRGSPKEPISEE